MRVRTIKQIIHEVISVTEGVNLRERKDAEILATSVILACRGTLTQAEINECLTYSKEVMNTYYNNILEDADNENKKESA